ncbi:hypothetical protein [Brevundimonas sp.]|uniref:hypothetical protein n=1 Tax=Brevundimonas sp. TaxID=1871086 RepID=UPI003BAD0B98
MAVITSLSPTRRERALALHRTQVTGFYGVFENDGRKFIQIDTLGSSDRQMPGKLSQTIQLDQTSAHQLWRLLGTHFDFK